MGLLRAVGSFGVKLWRAARETLRPVATALGYGDLLGVPLETGPVLREYRALSRVADYAARVADVAPSEYIPRELYVDRPIPFARPYGYTVTAYGRERATGRFARPERDIAFSREMTVEEILDAAGERFGGFPFYEGSPALFDIYQMSVTAAWSRPGEVL